MTAHVVRVDVLGPGGSPNVPVIPGAWFEETDTAEPGAFEVRIPETAPQAAGLTVGNLVRFNVGGTPDFTGLIEDVQVTVRGLRPADRVRTARGRDWLCEFDRALVQPAMGRASKPAVGEVRFNWTHPAMRTPTGYPGLVNCVNIGSVLSADRGLIDPLPQSSPQSNLGAIPAGVPDAFLRWYWSQQPPHPPGTVYFFGRLNLAAGFVVICWTCDNIGRLSFDGATIDEGSRFPASQWGEMTAVAVDNVSAGFHYIHAKVDNYAPWRTDNPGGFAVVAYQPLDGSDRLVFDNVVFRTERQSIGVQASGTFGSATSGDLKIQREGGGWRCLPYPASPPGFTVGKAFRLMFDQAQAAGALPGWTLGFTDTVDSAGAAWTVDDLKVAKVNDTLTQVMQQWTGQGFAEFGADPATRTLHAWRWGTRGSYPTPVVAWLDDQLTSLTTRDRLT